MNLDGCTSDRRLFPRVIPVLILIDEWGTYGKSPLMEVDMILYLMQCIQLLYQEDPSQVLTMQALCEKLDAIGSLQDVERFRERVQVTTSNFLTFVDLFTSLKTLYSFSDENNSPLIDCRQASSVLGGFLRWCILEFERLSFAQVCRLQKEWREFATNDLSWELSLSMEKSSHCGMVSKAKRMHDFTLALKAVIYPQAVSGKEAVVNVDKQALQLARLMVQFHHHSEASLALDEAIRLAQLNKNASVLEHSLAMLQKLRPAHSHNTAGLLRQFIKNATEMKQPLLVSTGKLQMARNELIAASSPKSVLAAIQDSEVDAFQSYNKLCKKEAIRSASLLLRAAAWRQYGQRSLALLPLQLVCHMRSHDSHACVLEPSMLEVFAKAICAFAEGVAEESMEQALLLLQAALGHFPPSSSPRNLLSLCIAKISLQLSLRRNDRTTTRIALDNIRTFDKQGARYWEVVVSKYRGNFKGAMDLSSLLLRQLRDGDSTDQGPGIMLSNVIVETMTLLQQGKVLLLLSKPSRASMKLTECIALCRKHNLFGIYFRAKLFLAKCQLMLLQAEQCQALVLDCFPSLLAHGSHKDIALAYLLLSQCTTFMHSSQSNGGDTCSEEGIKKALCLSYRTLNEFQGIHPPPALYRQALLLQSHLFHRLGDTAERDRVCSQLLCLEKDCA